MTATDHLLFRPQAPSVDDILQVKELRRCPPGTKLGGHFMPLDGNCGGQVAGKPEASPSKSPTGTNIRHGRHERRAREAAESMGDNHPSINETTKQQAQRIASEPIAPPSEGDVYHPDVLHTGEHGITQAARVGVPGHEVPPPPDVIPRLPNLTPDERAVEEGFASRFEKDPDELVRLYDEARNAGRIGEAPNVFGTDDVKALDPHWTPPEGTPMETVLANRARYNTMLHQTANPVAKKAFLNYLDKLPDNMRTVLVTAGGCGAGKGYAIKKIGAVSDLKAAVGAVWDSAGDQNGTELPWIQKECEARGIKVTYAHIHADPRQSWAAEGKGVVSRAKINGRMVDAHVFVDSYAIGNDNFKKFADAHQGKADFIYVDNSRGEPKQVDTLPPDALSIDREDLYKFTTDTVHQCQDCTPAIKRGATIGARIWGPLRHGKKQKHFTPHTKANPPKQIHDKPEEEQENPLAEMILANLKDNNRNAEEAEQDTYKKSIRYKQDKKPSQSPPLNDDGTLVVGQKGYDWEGKRYNASQPRCPDGRWRGPGGCAAGASPAKNPKGAKTRLGKPAAEPSKPAGRKTTMSENAASDAAQGDREAAAAKQTQVAKPKESSAPGQATAAPEDAAPPAKPAKPTEAKPAAPDENKPQESRETQVDGEGKTEVQPAGTESAASPEAPAQPETTDPAPTTQPQAPTGPDAKVTDPESKKTQLEGEDGPGQPDSEPMTPEEQEKFNKEWDEAVSKMADTIEQNNVADHPFSAQQIAAEQDWHAQFIKDRWGLLTGKLANGQSNQGQFGIKFKEDDIGVMSRFMSGLMSPLVGGAQYLQGLLNKWFPKAKPDEKLVSELADHFGIINGEDPQAAQAAAQVAANVLGPQAVGVAKQMAQQKQIGAPSKTEYEAEKNKRAEQAGEIAKVIGSGKPDFEKVRSMEPDERKEALKKLGAPQEIIDKADEKVEGENYQNVGERWLDSNKRRAASQKMGAAGQFAKASAKKHERRAEMAKKRAERAEQKKAAKEAKKQAKAEPKTQKDAEPQASKFAQEAKSHADSLADHAKPLHASFVEHLDRADHLSHEQRLTYSKAAANVFGKMPKAAAERAHGAFRKINFFGSKKELTEHIDKAAADKFGWSPTTLEKLKKARGAGKLIGGAFSYNKGEKGVLTLDGGDKSADGDMPPDHTYAHEFTHAIDGTSNRISAQPGWKEAWQEEAVDGFKAGNGVSEYATTSPEEGFAEFGRLIYAGGHEHAEIEKKFPKMAAHWKQHEIWPE